VARDLFIMFDNLIQSAQHRRISLLREIKTRRQFSKPDKKASARRWQLERSQKSRSNDLSQIEMVCCLISR
jgi:hypothetical protein